jgi:hypothetical protein
MELLEEENKRPQNNKEYFSKKQQAQQYVNLFEETIRNTIVKK